MVNFVFFRYPRYLFPTASILVLYDVYWDLLPRAQSGQSMKLVRGAMSLLSHRSFTAQRINNLICVARVVRVTADEK